MSEIKGQLLGMLMVISIFGAISWLIYSSFVTVGNQVAEEVTIEPQATLVNENAATGAGVSI